jgi:hypothetical protein
LSQFLFQNLIVSWSGVDILNDEMLYVIIEWFHILRSFFFFFFFKGESPFKSASMRNILPSMVVTL